MRKRPPTDTDPMYLRAFRYMKRHPSPLRDDEYLSMCINMSEPEELPFSEGSKELKDAMLAVRDLIIGPKTIGNLDLIKQVRTKENIPRSQFWWYIDEL
ncbi:MAG: hypothetical protein RBR69_07060 [Candidatus Cloacimonadaceae bacterium]|jgi:hypothetical protein|nr:hypothetical protein [Candidatus Cloacimonadota bacterium]MDY0127871.1 hypothetical protein [Candidatus Cloacimonadaceae bacterium]MCB5254266.1 hypothetical protein [Candidatus Cloacimonadota bacterium]MCK9178305.1 hypothetical protein [Candidatus Cloacimonadota bacterium]MCK9242539.1 hypothetical protein [Candidatus Cloacimonadota bacterium]